MPTEVAAVAVAVAGVPVIMGAAVPPALPLLPAVAAAREGRACTAAVAGFRAAPSAQAVMHSSGGFMSGMQAARCGSACCISACAAEAKALGGGRDGGRPVSDSVSQPGVGYDGMSSCSWYMPVCGGVALGLLSCLAAAHTTWASCWGWKDARRPEIQTETRIRPSTTRAWEEKGKVSKRRQAEAVV